MTQLPKRDHTLMVVGLVLTVIIVLMGVGGYLLYEYYKTSTAQPDISLAGFNWDAPYTCPTTTSTQFEFSFILTNTGINGRASVVLYIGTNQQQLALTNWSGAYSVLSNSNLPIHASYYYLGTCFSGTVYGSVVISSQVKI